MFAAMQAYVAEGFDGPMRPEHMPTMEGEANHRSGYETLGQLFALGYMRGLIAACEKTRPTPTSS